MIEEIVQKQFGVVLGNFSPCASYYEDMDYVEYISEDVISVAERIDPCLTLLWDKNQDSVIGFKVKGFRNFFEKTLKPLYDLRNEEFVELTSAIEHLYTEFGNKMLLDVDEEQQKQKRWAYRQALMLAEKHQVMLFEVPKAKLY